MSTSPGLTTNAGNGVVVTTVNSVGGSLGLGDTPPRSSTGLITLESPGVPWHQGQEHQVAGVYVGAGQTPVSTKLADRIHRWEFIDMGELLPEVQLFGEEGKPSSKKQTVTDILM